VSDIEAGAIPYQDTAVVDQSWDAAANLRRLGDKPGKAKLRAMHAWVDPNGDPEAKSSYKLPHHEVDSNGNVGAANLAGVRNALSRLGQSSTQIPAADKGAVERHLNRHLNKGKSAEAIVEEPGTWLSEMAGHLWAMRPESLGTLVQLAAAGRLEVHVEAERSALRRAGRPKTISGGVARVPLKGVLAPMGGLFAMLFGDMNPLDSFRQGMREAMADPDVGAVVIEVDSPGGVVDGIPEAAAELRDLRSKTGKPVVASVNTLAASAAYWIASQADEISVTPSGAAGSIGVYATHRDLSGAMELMGVKATLISAGKYKVDGNPFEPLSDSAREAIQADVDDFYSMFVADVAKGRSAKVADVRAGYGEGRVLNAKRALDANLVDRIETTGETVARLSSRSRGGTALAQAEAEAGATREKAEAETGAADVKDERARDNALLELLA
jgi:signal peptide peptidase SppA